MYYVILGGTSPQDTKIESFTLILADVNTYVATYREMYAVGWSILLGVTSIIQTIESSSTNENGTMQ